MVCAAVEHYKSPTLLQVFEMHFCNIISSQVPQIEVPLVLIDSCDRMDSLCVVMAEELHMACSVDLHNQHLHESQMTSLLTYRHAVQAWNLGSLGYLLAQSRGHSMCPMLFTTIIFAIYRRLRQS